jgi:ABC-type nitrate/sulfonate/bicarbonate transport system substrate-binding protein
MGEHPTRRTFVVRAGIGIAAGALVGRAPRAVAQTSITVDTFSGLTNLPIFAAEKNGLFTKCGLAVDVTFTANSKSQREGLADGKYQIIHTAADNAVAMVELAKTDVAIVTGGDNGLNRIFAQPDITSLSDLRGKTLVVDAPNTAFALLLYKALEEAGLSGADYKVNPVGGTPQRLNAMLTDKAHAAAGILSPPLSFDAAAAGLKDLGSATKAVGPYQSGSVVVMRSWAKANSDTLIRYIQAIVEGRRWALDPANKNATIALLVDRLKLSDDYAAKCYAVVTDPVDGLAQDAKFSMQGFENVLKLRAEIEGQWGGHPPAPDRYIDLSYYNKAVAGL